MKKHRNSKISTKPNPNNDNNIYDNLQESKIITGSWVCKNSLQVRDLINGKLLENIQTENREENNSGEYLYAVQFFDGDLYGEHAIVGGSGIANVEVINIKDKHVSNLLS